MKWTRMAFKLHRYLAYVLFAQLLAWIAGGALFALIPFDGLTKSGDLVQKPVPSLQANWQRAWPEEVMAGVTDVSVRETPHGAAWRIARGKELEWRLAENGALLPPVAEKDLAAFAARIYRGPGTLVEVRRIDQPEYRLGIVDELYGQTGVWQVRFDDGYGSRLYFDGVSGEFLKARNHYWVWFDFFWRLHVMDYRNGEDFNNTLLRITSVLALLFAVSGLVLTWNAAWRELSRARR
ncbi:PepSY domain-containing protein [Chitinibacteraceae bacterium HSL-7]